MENILNNDLAKTAHHKVRIFLETHVLPILSKQVGMEEAFTSQKSLCFAVEGTTVWCEFSLMGDSALAAATGWIEPSRDEPLVNPRLFLVCCPLASMFSWKLSQIVQFSHVVLSVSKPQIPSISLIACLACLSSFHISVKEHILTTPTSKHFKYDLWFLPFLAEHNSWDKSFFVSLRPGHWAQHASTWNSLHCTWKSKANCLVHCTPWKTC